VDRQNAFDLERVSLRSFLACGHNYHLYVYDDIKNVPDGVILKDASEILPSSDIFQYTEHKSYAGFANFFRYELLRQRGGWWVDLDVVCLKSFSFQNDYVFASERDTSGRECVTNAVIRAPQAAPILADACTICRSKEPKRLKWGETGPDLLHDRVRRHGLWSYVVTATTFCPIDYFHFIDCVLPGGPIDFGEQTFAVHLWNEMWRRQALDKNETYAASSLFEHLKRRYLNGSTSTRH